MFADWKNDVAHVKKSFGALGKKYPKMLQAYGALGAAAAEGNVLAVAVTTRCESCIGVHADEAVKAGATEEEVAAALAMSIALNAGAAYTYSLRALEAYNAQKGE